MEICFIRMVCRGTRQRPEETNARVPFSEGRCLRPGRWRPRWRCFDDLQLPKPFHPGLFLRKLRGADYGGSINDPGCV